MRREIFPLLAVAALIPIAGSKAQNAAAPSRKPGWWEMQLVISGATPEPIHQTQRICTNAEVDKRESPFGVNMSGPDCPAPTITRMSDHWMVSGACRAGTSNISADATATGDLNDRYHADIAVHMNPPPQPGASEIHIGMDARWLGQCPADKQPGQVEMVANDAPKQPAGK